MKNFINNELYKCVISDANIYSAIYSLESYVFEVGLLNDADLELYNKLSDKYDTTLINEVKSECKSRIEEVLTYDTLFDIEVYFKPKKYNEKKERIDFRPLHTADLYTQISIVAMLNIIMFDDTDGKRRLSDISKLLPSNFYGNMPSVNVEQIFQPWSAKYKEYSENSIKANNEYSVSRKYTSEINLDLKGFYPSINPQYIYEYILKKLPVTYKKTDVKVIKQILNKLLNFNVKSPESISELYYPEECRAEIIKKELFYRGV